MSQPPRPSSAPGKRRSGTEPPPSFTLDPAFEQTNNQQSNSFSYSSLNNRNEIHEDIAITPPSTSHYQQSNNINYLYSSMNNNNQIDNNNNSDPSVEGIQNNYSKATILSFNHLQEEQQNQNQNVMTPEDVAWVQTHQRFLNLQQQQQNNNNIHINSNAGGNLSPSSYQTTNELPPRTPPLNYNNLQITPPQSGRSVISLSEESQQRQRQLEENNNINNSNTINMRNINNSQQQGIEEDFNFASLLNQKNMLNNGGNVNNNNNNNNNNAEADDFGYSASTSLSSHPQSYQHSHQQQPQHQSHLHQTDDFIFTTDEHSASRLRQTLEGTPDSYYSFNHDNQMETKADIRRRTPSLNNNSNPNEISAAVSRQPAPGDIERLNQFRESTLRSIRSALPNTGDGTTIVRNAVWDAIDDTHMAHTIAPNSIATMLSKEQLRNIPASAMQEIMQLQQEKMSYFYNKNNETHLRQVFSSIEMQNNSNSHGDLNQNNTTMFSHTSETPGSLSSSTTMPAEQRWSRFCAHTISKLTNTLMKQRSDEDERQEKAAAMVRTMNLGNSTATNRLLRNAALLGNNVDSSSPAAPTTPNKTQLSRQFAHLLNSTTTSTASSPAPAAMLSDTAYSTINTVKYILNDATKFLKSEGRLNRLLETEAVAAKDVIRESKLQADQLLIDKQVLENQVDDLKGEIARLNEEIQNSTKKVEELRDVRHKLQLGIARSASKVLGETTTEAENEKETVIREKSVFDDEAEAGFGSNQQNQSLSSSSSTTTTSSCSDDEDDEQEQEQKKTDLTSLESLQKSQKKRNKKFQKQLSSSSPSPSSSKKSRRIPISVKETDPLYYIQILETITAEASQLRLEMDAALFIATQQTEWAIKEGQEGERIVSRLAAAREQLQECGQHMLTMRNYIAKLEEQLGPIKRREGRMQASLEHSFHYHEAALWSSFAFGNLNGSHADSLESAVRGFLRSSNLSCGRVSIPAVGGSISVNNLSALLNGNTGGVAGGMLTHHSMLLNNNNTTNDSNNNSDPNYNVSNPSSTTTDSSKKMTVLDATLQRGQYPHDAYSLLPQKILCGVASVNTLIDSVEEQRQVAMNGANSILASGNGTASMMYNNLGGGGGKKNKPLTAAQQQQLDAAAMRFDRLQILDGISRAERKLTTSTVSYLVQHQQTLMAPPTSSSSSSQSQFPPVASLIFPIDHLLPVTREILSKFHAWPEGKVAPAKMSMTALFDGMLRVVQTSATSFPGFTPPSPATPVRAKIRIASDYCFALLAAMHREALAGYSEPFLVFSVASGQAPIGALRALPRLAERLFVRLQSSVGMLGNYGIGVGGGGGDAGAGGGAGGGGKGGKKAGGAAATTNATATTGANNATSTGKGKDASSGGQNSKDNANNNNNPAVPRDIFLKTVRDMFPRATEASLLALALMTFVESMTLGGGMGVGTGVGGAGGQGAGNAGGATTKQQQQQLLALQLQQQTLATTGGDLLYYVPYFKEKDKASTGLILTAIYRMALDEQRRVLEELQLTLSQMALRRYQIAKEEAEEAANNAFFSTTDASANNNNNTNDAEKKGRNFNNLLATNANKNKIAASTGSVLPLGTTPPEYFDENSIEPDALVSLRDIGKAIFSINPHCGHREMAKIVSVAGADAAIETEYVTRMKTDPTAALSMVNGKTGAKQPMDMTSLKRTVRVADAIFRIRHVLYLEMYDRLSAEADD